MGSIKALLHEDDTVVYPRVVGMYLPFEADKSLVNGIVSKIAHSPTLWQPPEVPEAMRVLISQSEQSGSDLEDSDAPDES